MERVDGGHAGAVEVCEDVAQETVQVMVRVDMAFSRGEQRRNVAPAAGYAVSMFDVTHRGARARELRVIATCPCESDKAGPSFEPFLRLLHHACPFLFLSYITHVNFCVCPFVCAPVNVRAWSGAWCLLMSAHVVHLLPRSSSTFSAT